MSEERALEIRRILVALDAATEASGALDVCATLAARVAAEMHGLFIEDVGLLQLARFPAAQEFTSSSAHSRPLELASVEAELRALAACARRALAASAERNRLPWSFRVVRDQVAAALTNAAADVDLLIVPATSRAVTRHLQLPPRTLAIAHKVPRPVLVLRRGLALAKTAVVAYDGDAAADRALRWVRLLFPQHATQLVILLVTKDAEHAQRLRKQATCRLDELGGDGSYRFVWLPDITRLAASIDHIDDAVLVVPPSSDLERQLTQQQLDALACAVLLLREP